VPTLIDRAYDLGLKGVAITDHDAVSGHVKAINYYNKNYKDKDFKLILGNEIYITRNDLTAETHEKGEKFYHFLLLSKNRKGHDQLRKLSSRAWGRGYYKNMTRVPTFIDDLEEVVGGDTGNLVGTTACLGGYTGNMFAMREFETIERFLSKMEGIFGRGNFYIELQPSTMPDQINYNDYMIDTFWGKYPFVFTTDSHYLKKEDSKIHKQFLQSKGGDREVDAFYSSAYLMDYDEVKKYFIEAGVPQEYIEEMKNNTNDIKDMVEDYNLDHRQIVPQIEYEENKIDKEKIDKIKSLFIENDIQNYKYLDAFLKTEKEADKYFIELILEGYYDKIYSLRSSEDLPIKERMERLDYELEQIYETSIKIEQSLSDYFITMAKMIEIIWEEGDSFVGTGRGSAAGFLINYLIGITQLDPQGQVLYLPPWRLT
jgi:DNA polymerase-3 subunit alpha